LVLGGQLPSDRPPTRQTYPPKALRANPCHISAVSITWLGHSTVLVEAEGVRLLTDPLLRPRVGHLRRVAGAAPRIAGQVDAVLLSHVHWDHLDLRSLDLVRASRMVVPRGAGRLLKRFEDVVELDEGEAVTIGALTVRATHAEHLTRRLPFGATTPSLGYLIEGSRRLYFAGDTDVFEGMRELTPLDVALLPIDGWGPRVGPGHLDPRRAVEALQLLRPRVAVPIHWGTYRRLGLSRDPATLREPAASFERLAAELAPKVEIRILAPGGRTEL
jgi:L-ascorbate metabolism protein UlaG (beta-lactamase superfamily)